MPTIKTIIQVVFFCANLLNLPEKIFAGEAEVSYVYSASGVKLATKAGNSFTYYRGSFIYNDSEPDHILQPEGLIRKTSGGYVYYYTQKDHLGSTRVLCHEVNGKMKADQNTDYYAFGLSIRSNDTNLNRYLYNGKELQDQTVNGKSLMLYDFGHLMMIQKDFKKNDKPTPAEHNVQGVCPNQCYNIDYYPNGVKKAEGILLWDYDPESDLTFEYGEWKYYNDKGELTKTKIFK